MKFGLDMSSLLWTVLRTGKDVDGWEVLHNGKMQHVNPAGSALERFINVVDSLLNEFPEATPSDLILVFEGFDSKRRRCLIEPTYKGNREGEKDTRAPEEYEQFNILKDLAKQTYLGLGAMACSQGLVEGDDTLAFLAKNLHEDFVVVTNDNDMVVLNGINDYDSMCMVRVNGEIGLNKYGQFDFKLVTLYKSLVGDGKDNVKGVPGFGPAKWEALLAEYGQDGAFELLELIRQGQRDKVAAFGKANNNCRLLGKIVTEWDSAVRSLKLVTLYPEWVNDERNWLEWEGGMVTRTPVNAHEKLKRWRQVPMLITADNYAQAMEHLAKHVLQGPDIAFDLETSTPDESDDWLEAQGNPDGVDVMGSELTGFSITFGLNRRWTYYVSVDHFDTKNVTKKQAREMLEVCFNTQKPIVVHNSSFELVVLYNSEDEDGTKWRDVWTKYGQGGFVPNIRDTQLESSYVDENQKLGLKFRSKLHLGYEQQSYDATTLLNDKPYPGGRETKNGWRYKMRELPATHVFGYGADDTICTAALHNLYRVLMQLDHHYEVYKEVELNAAYQHALNFYKGMNASVAECRKQEVEDDKVYADAWRLFSEYLTKQGWEGTVPPVYTKDITAAEIKAAYRIVNGLEKVESIQGDSDEEVEVEEAVPDEGPDAILSSRVRTPAKLALLLKAEGHEILGELVERAIAGNPQELQTYVLGKFTGAPKFKASSKQMGVLLYEVMGLPVRVRNKPTAKMKEQGIRIGNPKTDNLALQYAKRDATPEQVEVLDALIRMKTVATRRSLYYSKYPLFIHWKTGKIHPSHLQCSTNTRRASEAKPNKQQLPKHAKVEGLPPKFRAVIKPHKPGAVVVSMDFAAQELRIIADYSKDPNMVACFVGDNLKDMHVLTGIGILNRKDAGWADFAIALLTPEQLQSSVSEQQYAAFMLLREGTDEQKALFKEIRALGKKVNFTTEYGAQAEKLGQTLLVEESEAQTYIDAREDAFPVAKEWKQEVIRTAKRQGYVTTKKGARRHLSRLLASEDRFTASKAERQAVNFEIQGSAAEQTKLAEGRMWEEKIFIMFDAVCYGPVHDEVVASVMIEDLPVVLPKMHRCMVAGYADMEVPIVSSISFGPDFLNQIEIGEAATPEAIQAGLVEYNKLIAA